MVYYSRCERAERDVAVAVNKSILRIVVMKIVCNDQIIALKLKVKPVNILLVQVYMTSEYEDDEMEELHDIIYEILKRTEKVTNTIKTGEWKNMVGDK
jgi:hypothetical protein